MYTDTPPPYAFPVLELTTQFVNTLLWSIRLKKDTSSSFCSPADKPK